MLQPLSLLTSQDRTHALDRPLQDDEPYQSDDFDESDESSSEPGILFEAKGPSMSFEVLDHASKSHLLRGLLDNGADANFISERVLRRIDI